MFTKQRAFGAAVLALALTFGVATIAGAQTASVQIIHNSPDPLATTVDIYLDETLAIDDFAFRTATEVLELPADVEITIGVAPGNSSGVGDVLASFPVTLDSSLDYIVIASGVLDKSLPENPEGVDTAFTLSVQTGLRTMSTAAGSNVDIIAFHGSPDAPTVDVNAQGVGPLFTNLQFKQFAPDYITVPAASYLLDVTPAGQPDVVVETYIADLSGLGGGAAIVFASGYLAGMPNAFGLYAALPNGQVIMLPVAATAVDATTWGAIKDSFK